MRNGLIASAALHIAIFLLTVLVMPPPEMRLDLSSGAIPVDIVDIGALTTAPRLGPAMPGPADKPLGPAPLPPGPPPPKPAAPSQDPSETPDAPNAPDAPPEPPPLPKPPEPKPPEPKPPEPKPPEPKPPEPKPPEPKPPEPKPPEKPPEHKPTPPPEPKPIDQPKPPPDPHGTEPPRAAEAPNPKPRAKPPDKPTDKPADNRAAADHKPADHKPAEHKPARPAQSAAANPLAGLFNKIDSLKPAATSTSRTSVGGSGGTGATSGGGNTPGATGSRAPIAGTGGGGGSAPHVSDRLSVSEEDSLRQQISGCWNVDPSAREKNLAVDIKIVVNPNRTIYSVEIVDKARYQSDPAYRSMAESARRALLNPRCSPLSLPPDQYTRWREIVFTFNPRDMF